MSREEILEGRKFLEFIRFTWFRWLGLFRSLISFRSFGWLGAFIGFQEKNFSLGFDGSCRGHFPGA